VKLAYYRYYGPPLSAFQLHTLRVGKYIPNHWRVPS
jgi:hypothetical protein